MNRKEFEGFVAKGITKFKVIKPRKGVLSVYSLSLGEILTLREDDGSDCPYFYKEDGFRTDVSLERLIPFADFGETKFKVVAYPSHNKVIAKLIYNKSVVSVAEAKCSPEDEFNFLTGLQIAIARLVQQHPCPKLVLPKEALNAELI